MYLNGDVMNKMMQKSHSRFSRIPNLVSKSLYDNVNLPGVSSSSRDKLICYSENNFRFGIKDRFGFGIKYTVQYCKL